MTLFCSVRMAGQLNALIKNWVGVEQAATAVIGSDVAHHVVDAGGLLGLDPLRATPLDAALPSLVASEPERWVLVLPEPGRLGALRGPADLNRAALEGGAAVVACRSHLALVPYPVGAAVQWRVFAANPPGTPPTPYEAERALSETVLAAGAVLARLDVSSGRRPAAGAESPLGVAVPTRQQSAADRAARLLIACDVALTDDGSSLSSYEADSRTAQLRAVRSAAVDALCAAVTWLHR